MKHYLLQDSLRIWLYDFEQKAKSHGITDMDGCGIHLTRYMPVLIQEWIPTLPFSTVSSWSELKKALLKRFGLSEEVDNQRLLRDLK
ncbi:hypothetical protein BD560DRAFT_342934, partial [Blakeslea trispora]